MTKVWKKILRRWLPLVFIMTVLAGLIYVTVQQSYRQSANDPQIQMAEDAAEALSNDASIDSLVPSSTPGISIVSSLAPYIVIYDKNGMPVAGDGYLPYPSNCPASVANKLDLPCLPQGIFSSANPKTGGSAEDRVTWQPEPNIRQAIVVVPVSCSYLTCWSGYVMVGRSLREIEIRENLLEEIVGAAWLFAMIGSLCLEILFALWLDS